MQLISPFILAVVAAALVTPLIIWLARKKGWVVEPRQDRWHKKPTAVYGGVGIFIAFMVSFLATSPHPHNHWILVGGGCAMFLVGLIDDIWEMKPQIKFLAQLIIAIAAVSLGVDLDREVIPWAWLAMPLAVFWLVAITNAVNILDNMDGLSSGVVFVAGFCLGVGAAINHFTVVGPLAVMLAGASLGFLFYNFNPAKIFMGDCGSLFLGFTLAGTTILSANTTAGASSLALSVLIPLGALVVPIFDTTLVTFQRTSHGRSIAQGGRDHSSHRLVFLGLSERKSVLLLLVISLLGGLGSLALVRYATPLIAIVLVALIVVGLVFFGLYLGEVEVYYGRVKRKHWRMPVLAGLVMHKKQIIQIMVDAALLAVAYLAAWLLRFEGNLNPWQEHLIAQSLPWLVGVKLVALWLFGTYRGQWRYISVHDYVQLAKGTVAGSLVFVLFLVIFYRFAEYSRAVMIIDFFLAYIFVAGSRSLIRVFREKIRGHQGMPVIIFGAGDGGELLLRELKNNPSYPFQPVGFIDDDPEKHGQVIHGIKVLGTRSDLNDLISKHEAERVFISILSATESDFQDVYEVCENHGIECTRIQPIIKL
jgi:UDP-GlcNAc:undecaprenyl-phosphate/decaprenyl-phosphate GlcNAc-1-phosphate transferase